MADVSRFFEHPEDVSPHDSEPYTRHRYNRHGKWFHWVEGSEMAQLDGTFSVDELAALAEELKRRLGRG